MKYEGFGLGCMHMKNEDFEENRAVIYTALDEGVTYLNTGDFYGAGESEMVLGKALQGISRDDFYISVKFGVLSHPNGGPSGLDVRPHRIKDYLMHSLRQLRLDYIDLYQPARMDRAIPVEEIVGVMADLVKEGYIRHIGLSQIDSATLKTANAVYPIEMVEMDYSLFNRTIETDILPMSRKLGVSVAAFGILAHGLMSGRYTKEYLNNKDIPSNRGNSLFAKANIEKNVELVERLLKIANEMHISLPQLAHAWVASKGDDIIPIIGASKLKNYRDSAKAISLTLNPGEITKIEEAIPNDEIAGESMRNLLFENGMIVQEA